MEVDRWNELVCSAGLVEKWEEPEGQGRLKGDFFLEVREM